MPKQLRKQTLTAIGTRVILNYMSELSGIPGMTYSKVIYIWFGKQNGFYNRFF